MPPSPPWVWHLAHWWVKTGLALGRVAAVRGRRGELVDDLLAVGVGQAAPLASSFLARAAIALIRVGRQRLLLVERELGEADAAVLSTASRSGRSIPRGGAFAGVPVASAGVA